MSMNVLPLKKTNLLRISNNIILLKELPEINISTKIKIKLIELCKMSDVKIVNGRIGKDKYGEYTCQTKKRAKHNVRMQ